MMSRPPFSATDVATTDCCRDLGSSQLMSRLLNDVTALLPLQRMSRQLNDVATLISFQANVATTSDSVLTSQPLLDVATSTFNFLKILCRDFYLVSRPQVFCSAFNFVATLCDSLSLSMRRYNRSFLPRVHHLLQHHLASHLIPSQPVSDPGTAISSFSLISCCIAVW